MKTENLSDEDKKFMADIELIRSTIEKQASDRELIHSQIQKNSVDMAKSNKEMKWYEATLIIAGTLAVVAIVKLFL